MESVKWKLSNVKGWGTFPFSISCFTIYIFLMLLLSPHTSFSQIDSKASKKTRNLYNYLLEVSEDRMLFGHQDDLAYGVGWRNGERESDVKDIVGSYPAVLGWDVSKLGTRSFNIDSVDFENMKLWIRKGYKAGAINTISWHMDNWAIGKTSWDTEGETLRQLLPGNELHDLYKSKLDLFADFVDDLGAGLFAGKIPIVFRPFHEHTGGWFWWGAEHCTAEEYKTLWRFTVDYLRDEKGLHNLLYAYSPDVFRDGDHYLEYYPGDDYVDILGFDDYHDVGRGGHVDDLIRRLGILTDLAAERGKVAALTETGLESVSKDDWFTDILLSVKDDPKAKRIAYALVWRNSDKKHHYASFKGHASEADFQKFYDDSFTVFANDTGNPYK